jgi:hypothetical protein
VAEVVQGGVGLGEFRGGGSAVELGADDLAFQAGSGLARAHERVWVVEVAAGREEWSQWPRPATASSAPLGTRHE